MKYKFKVHEDGQQEEEKEDSHPCQKTGGNIPQVISEFFPEDIPLSQDDTILFGCLSELIE